MDFFASYGVPELVYFVSQTKI